MSETEREREIKTLSKDLFILIANNWLQLGWRPPCEVSKNLVISVAFSIGHGVIWLMQLFLYKIESCL